MSQRSGDFEQALRRLRTEYRAELPSRLDALELALEQARAEGTGEALQAARRQAHTLKGTSGSYGLSRVSRALETLEQALDALLAEGAGGEGSWADAASALEGARRELDA